MKRKRSSTRVALAATGLLVALVPLSPATAANWQPDGLSKADLQAALDSMDPIERDGRDEFKSSRYTVVAYTRAFQAVDESGGPAGHAASVSFKDGVSQTEATALAQSATREGLTISVSIAYCRECTKYRWDIRAYMDWSTWPSSIQGEDTYAVAWANGLALTSDSVYGVYTGGPNPLSGSRSDVTPNVGTAWSFYETNTVCNFPEGCYNAGYLNYGWVYASIRESSLQNKATNVVAKYFHTYADVEYSVSFSAAPGVSITPTTKQWSIAAFTSFQA